MRISDWSSDVCSSDRSQSLEYAMNKLTKFREIRFYQQNGRCHYCGDPMWTTDSAKFAKIYQVSNKQARGRQATAEHLIPRSKGGSDRRVNIVAACIFSNSNRNREKLDRKRVV